MTYEKNKILRCVGALLLTSILLLFGFKKDHDKTDVANSENEIEYKNSSRTKVAQLNISFALVESIFYENDSVQPSCEQFVKLVKSNELLNKQLNALNPTFKLDKGAKNFVF